MNDIEQYVENDRIFTIGENNKIILLMSYSVTNDPEKYLNNLDHRFMPHDPNGKFIVIENMVAVRFGFHLIPAIKDFFYSKFPNIEGVKWRRWSYPHDRIVTLRRRHAKQYSN